MLPSTLYRRARVWGAAPATSAVLVEGASIAWVGDEDRADALTPAAAVDLDGSWLAPAFVDAHVHTTSTGLALTGLDLTGVPSLAAALDRVEQAARAARGGPVLGTGWDETGWPERRPPTDRELDRASYGGVVYLSRTDVHSAVVSSALVAAVPAARSAMGFLGDGLVRQDAHLALRLEAYAALSRGQRAAAQRAALHRAAELGIGCVHECGGPQIGGEEDFTLLLSLDGAHPEVLGYWGELDGVERARELGAAGAAGDLLADGSLGSHTACLLAPYADAAEAGDAGSPYLTVADVARHVGACTRAGLQAGFHAIGDGALQVVLDGIAQCADELGPAAVRAARHRIEHAEMLTADHVAAMARLGLVASVQPAFDARWGGISGLYSTRVGARRAEVMNPFAALLAAGVTLALGSDAPVTPLDPWGAIRAAVRHRTAGSGLPVGAAFAAHTTGGWLAAGASAPAGAGQIRVGAPASFAVWAAPGDDLLDLDAGEPLCLRTVVRGREVYSR